MRQRADFLRLSNARKQYIQRMEDVLAIYERPLSEKEPVVCIEEKPVALHQDTRSPLPARPGRVARRDYE